MSDMVTGDFNYGSVDADTAAKLEYFAKSGKALIRKSQIQFIADMGKILSEARELLASHDKNKGKFIKWATAEFDVSKDTVYHYLNAWDRILSNGSTTYLNWSPTALYLASADDFPKPVMKKLEKIPATDLVRTSDVKRLIAANKPKPEPAAPSRESLEFTDDLDADGDPVWLTPAEDEDDTPEPVQVTPEKPEASIMLDTLGRQIPKNLRSASELAIQLVATGRELDKFRKLAKDYLEQPGGDWLRMQDISDCIKVLKDHFQQAAYHTACVKCGGKGCKVCEMTGWIPDYLKGTL
jgi:hypothetical protein